MDALPSRPDESADRAWDSTPPTHIGDRVVPLVLLVCTIITVSLTFGVILFTVLEALPFFASPGFTFREFLTGTSWQPVARRYGALPVLNATLMTVGIALLFAMPIGVGAAALLSQYVPPRARSILKPALEVVAGVPTIVYGFFALYYVTPLLKEVIGADVVDTFNTFSAGITMGILVLPVIITLADDTFTAVPAHLRDAPLSVGATRAEAFRKVTLPASTSGLTSVFVVALARVIGESIIVSLAAGSGPNFTFDPFQAAETATGYILRIARGEARPGTPDYTSIFALGVLLFATTFALNLVARLIRNRSHRRLSTAGGMG